jgi:hypothetical protein
MWNHILRQWTSISIFLLIILMASALYLLYSRSGALATSRDLPSQLVEERNQAAMRESNPEKYIEGFFAGSSSNVVPVTYSPGLNVPRSTFSNTSETYTTELTSSLAKSDDTWVALDPNQKLTISMVPGASGGTSASSSATPPAYSAGFTLSIPLFLTGGTSSDGILVAGKIQGTSQTQYLLVSINTTMNQLKTQWNNQNIVYALQQNILGNPCLITIAYRDVSYANASADDIPLGVSLYMNGAALQAATTLPATTAAVTPLLSTASDASTVYFSINPNQDLTGAMGPPILYNAPYTKDQVASLFVSLQTTLFKDPLPSGAGAATTTATPLATAANPLVISLSQDTLTALQGFIAPTPPTSSSSSSSTDAPAPAPSSTTTNSGADYCPFDDNSVCASADGCGTFDWSGFPHNATSMPKLCRESLNTYCKENPTDSFCAYLYQLEQTQEQQKQQKDNHGKKAKATTETFACTRSLRPGVQPRPSSVFYY